MKVCNEKHFTNGSVYLLKTDDGYPIELTDTFLPAYTKDAINEHTNQLHDDQVGSRLERWMIGVSVMSGCPVGCKFCATGQMKRCRNLTASEIVGQVYFILNKHPEINPADCMEFKINYTRMGEPFLNIEAVKGAIESLSKTYPKTHHYVSTIGVKGSDFNWIKGDITLQLSLHSLDETRRNDLIPFNGKMSIVELGAVRVDSKLKTTVNLTLVDENDFNIDKLMKHFNPDSFFIKLSPINKNCVSEANDLGAGVIKSTNIK